jgi:hypothetical protein
MGKLRVWHLDKGMLAVQSKCTTRDNRRASNLKVLVYWRRITPQIKRLRSEVVIIMPETGTDVQRFITQNQGRLADVSWLVPPDEEKQKSAYSMRKNVQLQ